jgi:ABC-type glycerol-3-phosphate transport system permease component
VGTVLLYAALLFGALLTLGPLVYLFTRAFMPESQQLTWPVQWIPRPPTITNFQKILSDPTLPVFRWLINSLFVATSVTALVLFICSLTAYAYARLEFPGRNVIFFLLLTSLMVPGAVTFIPNFLLMRNLHWLDSYNGLSDRNRLTLPVGLQVLGNGNYVQQGLTMAAAALASAPPLILYMIFQRRIVAGMALTGMGGR